MKLTAIINSSLETFVLIEIWSHLVLMLLIAKSIGIFVKRDTTSKEAKA